MKNKEYWIEWIKAAGVRAVKTMAQVAGSMLVIGAFEETAWYLMLQTTLVAGLASLLTSLAGLPEVQKVTANTETVEDDEDGENDIEKGN